MDASITKMVVMDHMDWFDPDAVRAFVLVLILDAFIERRCALVSQEEGSELDVEIEQMHRVLAKGGAVYWRSAAKKPWYALCLLTLPLRYRRVFLQVHRAFHQTRLPS